MEKRKKILCMKETGDSGKAFLGWYTASSRYRARSARDREAIERATANKTLWRPRFRAVNIFGFAVVLRDVFIHRDITKIGRDWSFRTGVSILNASERGVSTEQRASAKENEGLIRRKELT